MKIADAKYDLYVVQFMTGTKKKPRWSPFDVSQGVDHGSKKEKAVWDQFNEACWKNWMDLGLLGAEDLALTRKILLLCRKNQPQYTYRIARVQVGVHWWPVGEEE